MSEVIKEAMKFLGKSFTEEEVTKLCKHLSVESMRANPSCNNDGLVEMAKSLNGNGKTSGEFKFIRRGQVGSFKEEFNEELDGMFENYLRQQELIDNGFQYKF